MKNSEQENRVESPSNFGVSPKILQIVTKILMDTSENIPQLVQNWHSEQEHQSARNIMQNAIFRLIYEV
jgi:hypothetical protein